MPKYTTQIGTPKVWSKSTMGQRESSLDILPEYRRKQIQKVVGKFLYCGRSVNPTLLFALGSITEYKSKVKTKIEAAVHQFLEYCATHPNAKLRYHASDMILIIQSDVSYLSELKAYSISGGNFFMGYPHFKNTIDVF